MFKCKGICAECGRCKTSDLMNEANERKAKMFSYPEDFKPEQGGSGYAIAFDIGTTTVVGMLWDLAAGKQICAGAETNSQNRYGMDVISRITYCGKEGENLQVLQDEIIGCLNRLIDKLCGEGGIGPEQIVKAAACGNTTMSHILLGQSPASLAVAPFLPAYEGAVEVKCCDLGLNTAADALLSVVPNIAGHVGGDVTAGACAAGVFGGQGGPGAVAFVDIGTNGEMVITDGGEYFACSTAAGPAFEGASIADGMRAADGAIEKVVITRDDVFFKTIGGYPPQGICGSGLIDAVAQMLEAGLVNKKGRLASDEEAVARGAAPQLASRLIEEDGQRKFILVAREGKEDIVITQNDIREVQLAKGAVAAGIVILLDKLGKTVDDLEKVMIAGAFGNYIDKASAVRIGLLPQVDPDKIVSVGNAAGAGVSMAMTDSETVKLMKEIPERVQHVDLAAEATFQKTYMKSMGFK